ncbi:dihydrodipicolinate synthase family protein [Cohnella herbarum]|uniref:4-hydroxy-tetrahydrodipicolinate synthase n=1 Tax=Cohnella herbarum TaxID=2728023 RepID=A0A7Z2VR18_9BACL|nr:dihydrodipicolinate synthase family protein [Cohnella herbarum]QJD87941.1 4-hydroxy-tetrahydrodipicolinate synthase [Cohnella herbarum]
MLTEQTLHGIIVPIITPFNRRGNLDIKSFRDMVKRLANNGVHGLVIDGTTGASSAIELIELKTLILTARKAMGDIPLIVDTGSNNIATTVTTTVWAKSLGADAAIVVAPSFDRPSQQSMIQYFHALSDARLPIILHDHPRHTGMTLELETIQEITRMDHILGIKDSTGDIKRCFKLARYLTKPILCGEDELFFASLCYGGSGGIMASANLDSDQFVQVYELYRFGKIDQANRLFNQLLPLIQFLSSEPNPAPLQWLLAERGHIRSDRLRPPATTKSTVAEM